jgi:hypothetical protein
MMRGKGKYCALGVLTSAISVPGRASDLVAEAVPAREFLVEQEESVQAASFAVHVGRGLDSNLRMIPGQIATNSLPWENTWYLALVVNKPVMETSRFLFGLESSLLKHCGMQSNFESTLAGTVKYRIPAVLGLLTSATVGEGVSYAYSSPTFEKGPNNSRQGQVKFQNHLVFEFAIGAAPLKDVFLVTRIHHRSGVYGLFGPPHIGSNFLAFGINYNTSL